MQTLQYPLENKDEYKGQVLFSIIENVSNFDFDISEVKRGFESTSDKVRSFLVDDKTSFLGENNKSIVKPRREVTKSMIKLYLPPGLQYRDNVSYDNFDLGFLGATAENLLKGGQGQGAAAAKALTDGIGSFINTITGNAGTGDIAKLGGIRVAKTLGADFAEGAYKSSFKVTTNPNTRVLFKQVNIREFAFTFKLIGRSQRESEEIKRIVRMFRTELYPEDIKGQIDAEGKYEAISLGYKFPNKFRIQIVYDGKPIAHRIKDAYLRDVTVTYNSSSMAMHPDGNFTEVDLNLAFIETSALVKDDIIAGF